VVAIQAREGSGDHASPRRWGQVKDIGLRVKGQGEGLRVSYPWVSYKHTQLGSG